jgi:hypothetical protein
VPRICHIYIDNKIILTNKKDIKNMSLSKKHFKKLVELICNNYDAKTNKINMGFTSELSSYLKEQNNRFDSVTFFNAIKEGTKSVVEKHKEFLKNKKDLLKENKILQSKVKTYEQDINNINDVPNGRPFKGF